jgi:hypothetical protein
MGKKKYDARVQELLQECRFFSEWTVLDTGFETQAALATLQHDLQNWQNDFQSANGADNWRAEINAACERWANRILELSGLLKTGRSGVVQV